MILTKLCQIKTPGPLGFILLGMVSLLGDSYRKHMALTMAGETEWTKNGRYTGITELELTDNGVQQCLGTKKTLLGPGKLIDPAKLAHVFVSPRKRAQKTFDLLFHGVGKDALDKDGKVSITEELAEWDYGKCEGLLTKEIRARRKEQGLDKEVPWDIWRDGCEDGECVTPCHTRVLELG
jgi:broad specificity phosphatase PhoE